MKLPNDRPFSIWAPRGIIRRGPVTEYKGQYLYYTRCRREDMNSPIAYNYSRPVADRTDSQSPSCNIVLYSDFNNAGVRGYLIQ